MISLSSTERLRKKGHNDEEVCVQIKMFPIRMHIKIIDIYIKSKVSNTHTNISGVKTRENVLSIYIFVWYEYE
jgi:hypothetical protein